MGQELDGKVAIVTGGASGIGRAVCRAVRPGGSEGRRRRCRRRGGRGPGGWTRRHRAFRRTDVSDADDVQALVDFAVDRFGGLHVMFNNAGITSSFRRFFRNDLRDSNG